MRRIISLLAVFFLLTLAAFSAQLSGGLMFPGPGMTSIPPVAPPSGMSVWYSADCITYSSSVCGVPAGGTTLTTWADRSGNANTATVATGTCTYQDTQINGRPAISMASCGLNTASDFGPGSGIWTIFAVFKRSDTTSKMAFTSCNGITCAKYYTGSSALHGFENSDFVGYPASISTVDLNWHQTNVLFQNPASGGTYAYRKDRADDGSGSDGTTYNTAAANNAIGYDRNTSNQFFAGQLAELIYYNFQLSGTQITQVETYLNTKYGL